LSIVDATNESRVTFDGPASALREAISGMDVKQARGFVASLLQGCGMPWTKVADVMRATKSTVRADASAYRPREAR
jgi:hypothetical protein